MAKDNSEVKVIGGYFELADKDCDLNNYPPEGILLNTCRNALEYIISQLQDVKHIYLPLYTCEAVVEPLKRLQVSFDFYHINTHFEIADDITLKNNDYIIANNYFGLKDAYIAKLSKKYDEHLIVDNAQAFFAPILSGIKAAYSARKYVGVADGGFAVGVSDKDIFNYCLDETKHDSHLLIRKQYGAEAGFKEYQKNELLLNNQPIRRMSSSTYEILSHIDFKKIVETRLSNFEYLHKSLASSNQLEDTLNICLTEGFACPMIYPYVGCIDDNIRERLIKNKVFVARYWPNVFDWAKPDDFEYELTNSLIPLPIDQRYGKEDMDRILSILKH